MFALYLQLTQRLLLLSRPATDFYLSMNSLHPSRNNSFKVWQHVNRWDSCLTIYSWNQSNGLPEVDMDNASSTVSHTALVHPPMKGFQVGLDTDIYLRRLRFSWGGSKAEAEKRGPNFWRSSCVWERKLFIKNWGVMNTGPNPATEPDSAFVVPPATVLRDPSRPQSQIRRAIRASTAGESIRHSWVLASLALFREGRTAPTNTETLMNGVCHREREKGKVFRGTMWSLGQERQQKKGVEVTSNKPWRAVWKVLLRCVIFADVHYTLAGVKKISGITVLPFVFGE